MLASDETLALLRSIDASLKQLLAVSKVSKPKEIAPDSDLDGQYGDPIVKAADPRDWTGPTQKGKRFSECSSEYLELVASRLDYFADQAEKENKLTSTGKPVAPFNRREAARARGWAKRVREGRVPVAVAVAETWGTHPPADPATMDAGNPWASETTDDDIPF